MNKNRLTFEESRLKDMHLNDEHKEYKFYILNKLDHIYMMYAYFSVLFIGFFFILNMEETVKFFNDINTDGIYPYTSRTEFLNMHINFTFQCLSLLCFGLIPLFATLFFYNINRYLLIGGGNLGKLTQSAIFGQRCVFFCWVFALVLYSISLFGLVYHTNFTKATHFGLNIIYFDSHFMTSLLLSFIISGFPFIYLFSIYLYKLYKGKKDDGSYVYFKVVKLYGHHKFFFGFLWVFFFPWLCVLSFLLYSRLFGSSDDMLLPQDFELIYSIYLFYLNKNRKSHSYDYADDPFYNYNDSFTLESVKYHNSTYQDLFVLYGNIDVLGWFLVFLVLLAVLLRCLQINFYSDALDKNSRDTLESLNILYGILITAIISFMFILCAHNYELADRALYCNHIIASYFNEHFNEYFNINLTTWVTMFPSKYSLIVTKPDNIFFWVVYMFLNILFVGLLVMADTKICGSLILMFIRYFYCFCFLSCAFLSIFTDAIIFSDPLPVWSFFNSFLMLIYFKFTIFLLFFYIIIIFSIFVFNIDADSYLINADGFFGALLMFFFFITFFALNESILIMLYHLLYSDVLIIYKSAFFIKQSLFFCKSILYGLLGFVWSRFCGFTLFSFLWLLFVFWTLF